MYKSKNNIKRWKPYIQHNCYNCKTSFFPVFKKINNNFFYNENIDYLINENANILYTGKNPVLICNMCKLNYWLENYKYNTGYDNNLLNEILTPSVGGKKKSTYNIMKKSRRRRRNKRMTGRSKKLTTKQKNNIARVIKTKLNILGINTNIHNLKLKLGGPKKFRSFTQKKRKKRRKRRKTYKK